MFSDVITMEKAYFYVAAFASGILILQTLLTFLGLSGEVDVDFDGDGDVDISGGSGLTIFSFRNLIAFLTFFGWSGLWFMEKGLITVLVVLFSVIVGCIFMGISMGIFYMISKMQRSGNLVLSNAIGLTGEVYIRIPSNRGGTGKIMLTVQGALRELEALTDDLEDLKSGMQVEVVDVVNSSKLLVTHKK